ncbi:hypothetical protein LCGC14_2534370, partial [marine sediment metagenome]
MSLSCKVADGLRRGRVLVVRGNYLSGVIPPPAPQGLLLCSPKEETKKGRFRFYIR